MKSPFLYLVFALATATSIAQDADPKAKLEADLQKARELFPQFQKLLETDPVKAKEPFEQFLKMQDPMQLRLQTWLDTKWAEKRREYEMAIGGSNAVGAGGLSDSQKASQRENRALLLEIRQIQNEDEMKTRLKKEGWNALEKLLTISKRSGGSSSKSSGLSGDSGKAVRALKDLIAVGNFRYKVRLNRSEPAKKPHEELGLPDPGEGGDSAAIEVAAAESITAERADRAVLEKNEKMKDEIPRGEYDGILELNQWRIAMGLNALLIDPKLCDAARDHSKDMKTLGFFAHDSPVEGKKSPWDRAANFGTKANAENIAINGSPAGANKAWFYSPGHHKNMFAAGKTYVGLGQEGRHFTQLFR